MKLIAILLLIVAVAVAVGMADAPKMPNASLVRVYVQSRLGAADPAPLLPDAWAKATGGRGRLVLVPDRSEANAVIEVVPNDCLNDSWQVNPSQRAVMICVGSQTVQRYGVVVIVHEIAHIWCCDVGYPDGHWPDDAEPGLMNDSNYGVERGVFSPRELRALGLN